MSGERGIRTLAPVARPTPLAGAPLRPLEYFSVVRYFQYEIVRPASDAFAIIQEKKSLVKPIFSTYFPLFFDESCSPQDLLSQWSLTLHIDHRGWDPGSGRGRFLLL